MKTCWCGNSDLAHFGGDYARCDVCGTLVSLVGLSSEKLLVNDDETDFYGKSYWFGHQSDDLGFPDIHQRARGDLIERNLHWLRTVLRYGPPPASLLELGCSHGSFVALMQQAGYDATGLEMSPWVVEFGRETFGIPMILGPVEDTAIAPGSLDIIALMDVLEHLPDPVATMVHCRDLLKSGGILVIQTPQFREEMTHEHLIETSGDFLEQLKTNEHLFLFGERSVQRLLGEIGFGHVAFEPAMFARYDMFLVAGREPLAPLSRGEAETALLATSQGRMALALLDLSAQIAERERHVEEIDADRKARLEQIEALSLHVEEIYADRSARLEQIHTLTEMVHDLQDRTAKGKTW